MQTQPLTINIPTALFSDLRERAEQAQRSVEEETLEVLASSVSADALLPQGIARELSLLTTQSDDLLWETARRPFPTQSAERLEALHACRAQEELSESELKALEGLTHQYERHMLLRAQAVALLKQRGHDVSELLQK